VPRTSIATIPRQPTILRTGVMTGLSIYPTITFDVIVFDRQGFDETGLQCV